MAGEVAVNLLCPTTYATVCAIFATEWWLAVICAVVCGSTCSALEQLMISIDVGRCSWL